jgi:SAM-dependent methyltransferase
MNSMEMKQDCRRVEGGRLAYYRAEADSNFWDSVWQSVLSPSYLDPYLRGELSFFQEAFETHLPRTGRILEAGCGIGQYVAALRSRGYDCVGIDYASTTVEAVKKLVPDLPVLVGDITAMSFGDNSFSAVLSLGVVEHRRAGPEPYLREMRRVLQDEGRILVSVPHFNVLRRARARRGAYVDHCDDMPFYQWAFQPAEFRAILAREGFDVVAEYDYNYSKCLANEIPVLNLLPDVGRRALIRACGFVPRVRRDLGHMRLFVGTKQKR